MKTAKTLSAGALSSKLHCLHEKRENTFSWRNLRVKVKRTYYREDKKTKIENIERDTHFIVFISVFICLAVINQLREYIKINNNQGISS